MQHNESAVDVVRVDPDHTLLCCVCSAMTTAQIHAASELLQTPAAAAVAVLAQLLCMPHHGVRGDLRLYSCYSFLYVQDGHVAKVISALAAIVEVC
jgi:hypothetical protein